MTYEDLLAKHERLVDAVRRYRGNQKQWLKYHANQDLDRVKRGAREVDKLIDQEVKQKESKQKEIF